MKGTQVSERNLLRRRNSLSTSLQAGFDAVAISALVYLHSIFLQEAITMPYILMTLLLLGAMAVVYDRFSIYRSYNGLSEKALRLGKAWSLSFLILLLIGFLSKQSDIYSRIFMGSLFISGYFIQLAGHFFFRCCQNLNTKYHHPSSNALIIGTGSLANHLYERINKNPWLTEQIIGGVKIPGTEDGPNTTKYREIPVLGDIGALNQLIQEHDIQTVYIAVPLDSSSIVKEIYFDLLDANLDIHWVPNIFALNLVNHSVREIAGLPILTLSETPLIGSHLLIKTIEDRLIASIALLLLSPIMLITALMIKRESKGPVFFRQPRTGWDGKEFLIWKFRSMRVEQPEEDGTVKQATRDDPRITRVGRFIRKTSIDELPQLFNVLVGQMSLVGPRPHAVQHNQEYSKRITAYLARHRIKPGITGLAQVRGYRGETKELHQMEKRVEYDLEYINNWSLWRDLTIMAKTAFSLFGKNAY